MLDDTLTIRIQGSNGTWESIGTGPGRGIVAENVELTANEWGADTASFDLRRNGARTFPDLFARAPLEVEVGGMLVWSGRLKETPSRDGADPVINVQARGWQYHLDDDAYSKLYVHTGLTDFQDARSFFSANLGGAGFLGAGEVTSGQGILRFSFPKNTAVAGFEKAGAAIDLGPIGRAARVVVLWDSTNNDATTNFFVRGSDTDSFELGGNDANQIAVALNTGVTRTDAIAFVTPRRYVKLHIEDSGAGHTPGADVIVKVRGVQLFGSTAYESGNASILKADTIIKDALTRAPKLSTDLSQIGVMSFNIPEFVVGASAPKTVREVMEAANAFHNNVLKVDVLKRLVFQARPIGAIYEIGAWAGSTFEDSSLNSDEAVYNKVLVTGTGPDGVPIQITRTGSAPLLSRSGETNTHILPIQSPLTTTVANQIGDVDLAAHKYTPLKGTVNITGYGGVRRVLSGEPVHPAELLLSTTQLMRLSHRTNPDTGDIGRDGMISTVKYVHNDRAAEAKLDNDRTSFAAFIERLAVVTGAALQ